MLSFHTPTFALLPVVHVTTNLGCDLILLTHGSVWFHACHTLMTHLSKDFAKGIDEFALGAHQIEAAHDMT